MTDSTDSPVVVGVYPTLTDATLARHALQAEGLDAWLQNEFVYLLDTACWPTDGIHVVVRAEDRNRAWDLLQEQDQAEHGDD
ncbi:MAG: hypothetical protein AAF533_03495 [Acidobacteriota bacterium]